VLAGWSIVWSMVKGIQDQDPVERLAVLEILRQKNPTSASLSSRND
jgi:hypothetical protein